MIYLYILSLAGLGGQISEMNESFVSGRVSVEFFILYSVILSLSTLYGVLSIRFYFRKSSYWDATFLKFSEKEIE